MRSLATRLRSARVYVPLAGLFTLVGIGLIACISPPLESPTPTAGQVTQVNIAQNVKNKVDILFLVDNSNSMEAMQLELRNKFNQFFKPFQDLAGKGTFADLNIGVVTSDFGAGATGAPGCTPSSQQGGGDQGRLQGTGKKAAQSCNKPVGTNFIHYAFGPNGPSKSNLPPNQGLLETFTCMASVGSSGCGFEHQLEAVYAALHNNIPENQGNLQDPGFVRDDALLTVVFLTNEDDASAPYDTDVFDKNKVAQYGYEDSYSRQTRFAVVCGSPPAFPPYADSNGELRNCQAAPNNGGDGIQGKQFDIMRYINFFTSPAINGGVKTNPLDVVLVGIDAPEAPFQVILSNPGTPAGSPYVQCGTLNEQSNPPCVPVLQHSCVNPSNSAFFGDPSVRLNTVIRSVTQHQITSICENDYGPAIESVAKLIVSNLGGGCIPQQFPVDDGGHLVFDCNVQDSTLQGDGTKIDTSIPRCDPFDPSAAHAKVPCWVIAPKDVCKGASPDGVGLTIDRGKDQSGMAIQAQPHTSAIVTCATKAAGS